LKEYDLLVKNSSDWTLFEDLHSKSAPLRGLYSVSRVPRACPWVNAKKGKQAKPVAVSATGLPVGIYKALALEST